MFKNYFYDIKLKLNYIFSFTYFKWTEDQLVNHFVLAIIRSVGVLTIYKWV